MSLPQARQFNKPAERTSRGFNRIKSKNVKEMTLPQAVDILNMRTAAFHMRQALKQAYDTMQRASGLNEKAPQRVEAERLYNEARQTFNMTMESFRQKAESYFTRLQAFGGMTPKEQKKFRKLYGDPQKGFENGQGKTT